MPAKSKKQQMAAGAALSAKRGEASIMTPLTSLDFQAALSAKRGEASMPSLKGASKKMAESMSENELKELAATKRKNLPRKKG